MAEEKIVTINVRKELVETPKWKRSNAVLRILKKKLKRLAKGEKIVIGKSINEKAWSKSIRAPPTKFRIRLTKEDEEGKGEKRFKAELLEK
jgi:ribosomal protein L31E